MKEETKDQNRISTKQRINTRVNEEKKERKKHPLMTTACFDNLKQMKET